MGIPNLLAVSAAGMGIERLRVEIAALNLANENLASTPESTGFRPLRVVAHMAAPVAGLPFAEWMSLPQVSVEHTMAAPRMVSDPGHPMADAKGFVRYPGVDHANEMLTLMTAIRAYEANVAAMATGRAMILKTLEIGGA